MKALSSVAWPIISIALFIYLIIKSDKNVESPREKNGVDTIITYDSVYVVKFQIVDAYGKTHETAEQQ